jgi:hypothetical protein
VWSGIVIGGGVLVAVVYLFVYLRGTPPAPEVDLIEPT